VSDAAIGSTLYARYPNLRVGTSYLQLSGTSMAAAVASGAVALILEAQRVAHPGTPALTPNAVKAILQYSSVPVRDGSGASIPLVWFESFFRAGRVTSSEPAWPQALRRFSRAASIGCCRFSLDRWCCCTEISSSIWSACGIR
jgi:subtilisin family serine protease